MTTSALVLLYAPELASDTRIETMLARVTTQLSAEGFGTFYDDAVAALTAHILLKSPESTASGSAAMTGAVVSKKAGKRSVNYATLPVASVAGYDAGLATTAPGNEFLRLRDSSAEIGFGVF